jgi:hypothetical protein
MPGRRTRLSFYSKQSTYSFTVHWLAFTRVSWKRPTLTVQRLVTSKARRLRRKGGYGVIALHMTDKITLVEKKRRIINPLHVISNWTMALKLRCNLPNRDRGGILNHRAQSRGLALEHAWYQSRTYGAIG